MRVFVYEHLTALGLGRDPNDPLHSMYREGLAMRDAVAADFRAIPGVSVTFDEAEPHDRVLCIAPETDGVLLELSRRFADGWLGSSPEAIALTTDKLALFEHWRKHGVRTPATSEREPTPCEAFPVVWKPRDGCGSTDTYLLKDAFDLAKAKSMASGPMILQEFIPGRAASVAFIDGTPLVPCWQQLSNDGRFHYLGGELPIPAEFAERAIAIASAAMSCVDGLNGYVGVDVVLGVTADFAIEINPRLTTSYVGLRHVAGFNLAERMLIPSHAPRTSLPDTSPPALRGRGRRADASSISTSGEGDTRPCSSQAAPSPGVETARRGFDSDLSPAEPGERCWSAIASGGRPHAPVRFAPDGSVSPIEPL